MAPRISLICAPPHRNPGMYSVDLAFERVLARRGLRAEVRRYAYGGPYEAVGLACHDLAYLSLEQHLDEVTTSDLILFWGDYQHALSYWRTGLRRRPGGTIEVADERADALRVADHLLLAGQPDDVLARTLSFGTSLLGDDLRSLAITDTVYGNAFPAFIERVEGIWCRDPVSAAMAARHRLGRDETCLGVDAAHLLTPDDLATMADPTAPEGAYAAMFLGRLEAPLAPAAGLAHLLARGAGLQPRWIRWLGPGAAVPAEVQAAVPDLAVDDADTYEGLLALLLGAKLVITDAYHLCLLSWRLGTPAVCVGLGAQHPTRPVSDKKKEVFHLAQGLTPMYVFHESIAQTSARAPLAASLLELASDAAYVGAAARSLHEQATAAERRLWTAIERVLR